MRIAFMGKGGSGKTTLSAAFALFARQQEQRVLAIDGDVNMHMAPLFGADQYWLHTHKEEIKEYLEPEIFAKGVRVLGTLPPTTDSRFITLDDTDKFLENYATYGKHGIPLLTVGTYESKDAGANCYHGKLQVLELILHRIADKKDDVVVCDMTAGIDALGTSMFMAADMNVFLVEPTLKSVQVFKDFAVAAKEHGITTYALANKVSDEADESFIKNHIDDKNLIGTIAHSPLLRKIEQGDLTKLEDFVHENTDVFQVLFKRLAEQERDLVAYLEELKRIYRLSCEWWYNDFYGMDLTEYIDSKFTYETIFTA